MATEDNLEIAGLSVERSDLVRLAFQAFEALTRYERGLITCWFCHACGEEIPTDDLHNCVHDMD